MNIYIPGIGKKDFILFAPQIYSTDDSIEKTIITGSVDDEINEAVYVALTLLLNNSIRIPKYLHVHFPQYSYRKCGISASLGIYFSLFYYLKNIKLNYRYLMSGEIDIEGKIHEVGQIKEKINAFTLSKCDYLFIPYEKNIYNTKNKKIFFVSDIFEIMRIIDYLEKKTCD